MGFSLNIGFKSLIFNQIRITVRITFIVLLFAVIVVPFHSIKEAIDRNHAGRLKDREITVQRIIERLKQPAGQLALFNPDRLLEPLVPVLPVILPFDKFDKLQAQPAKAFMDQVNSVGCPIYFSASENFQSKQNSLCIGVARSDAQIISGDIFVSGTWISSRAILRSIFRRDLIHSSRPIVSKILDAHRLVIDMEVRDDIYRWIVVIEAVLDKNRDIGRLGLTAFEVEKRSGKIKEDVHFYYGHVEEGECIDPTAQGDNCDRESTFLLRIPRKYWGQSTGRDLPTSVRDIRFNIEILSSSQGSGKNAKLFSTRGKSKAESALNFEGLVQQGEAIIVRRVEKNLSGKRELFRWPAKGLANKGGEFDGTASRFDKLVLLLFSDKSGNKSDSSYSFDARGDSFELDFIEKPHGLDPLVVQFSGRMAGYALAMILVILIVWAVIELRVVRRVLKLTERTQELSSAIRGDRNVENFTYKDLGGRDELGVLANGIDDLLQRIDESVRRERVFLQNQESVLRAIGHEIRSPLQSLSALFNESSEGFRYVNRMLRAVKTLYGDAAPTDGFENASIEIEQIDLVSFIDSVAKNSPLEGVDNVVFENRASNVFVRVDPSKLEDVFSHILSNANRYRPNGTDICITLELKDSFAAIEIYNSGPHIPGHLKDRIFEFGVSDRPDDKDGHHGQGLFVSKTYLAKMGGTIEARNDSKGVAFEIKLKFVKK